MIAGRLTAPLWAFSLAPLPKCSRDDSSHLINLITSNVRKCLVTVSFFISVTSLSIMSAT